MGDNMRFEDRPVFRFLVQMAAPQDQSRARESFLDVYEDYLDDLMRLKRRLALPLFVWHLSCEVRVLYLRRIGSSQRNMSAADVRLAIRAIRDQWRQGWSCTRNARRMPELLYLLPENERVEYGAIVANVLYLDGNTQEARTLADELHGLALRTAASGDLLPLWISSYPKANTLVFSGDFATAADYLVNLANNFYRPLSDKDRSVVVADLENRSTLSSAASMWRHLIVCFACCRDTMKAFAPHLFPCQGVSSVADQRDLAEKLLEEAENACQRSSISSAFNRAYGAFYLTALLDEEQQGNGDAKLMGDLRARIDVLLASDPGLESRPKQYAIVGMRGVYSLVERDWESAIENLTEAISVGDRSGNQFFTPIFCSCLAVAYAHHGAHRKARPWLSRLEKQAKRSQVRLDAGLAERTRHTLSELAFGVGAGTGPSFTVAIGDRLSDLLRPRC